MTEANAVTPLIQPDRDLMRQHLEHLFGGDLDGYHDGLIELSWDAKWKGAGFQSALFPVHDIEAAIDEAVKQNSIPKQNVYIGATLKKPDTAPFGRTSDDDFYASTVIWADLDDESSVTAANERWQPGKPTQIVVTGRAPHKRLQLWWRLEEPITDPAYLRSIAEGMRDTFGGDPLVVNVGTLMRLGGTIAWPLKPGRVLERTEVHKPVGAPKFYVDTLLNDAYPPPEVAAPRSAGISIVRTQAPAGSLGLAAEGVVEDGREQYMRDTVMACFIEYVGENGCAPEAQELFDIAWPQYAAKVSFDRPGRREGEMAQKVKSTLQRFHSGRIRDLKDLDDVVKAYQAKPKKERIAPTPEAPRPARNDAGEIEMEDDGIRDLPTIDFDDIKPTGNVHTLVHKLLGPSAISMLVAPGGAYKSFIALDISLAVAQGLPWRGRKTTQGIVIYVAAEGAHGMRQRVQAYRVDKKTGAGVPFVLAPASLNLTKGEGDARALLKICKAAEKRFGLPVVMIVVDTLHRNYGGADENDASAAGSFMQNLDLVREATGAHIMVVHHTGKDEDRGARGSSSLKFAIDTEIVVTKHEGQKAGVACVTRQKDGEEGAAFPFKMRTIGLGADEDGAEITSLVIDHVETDEMVRPQAKHLTTQQSLAMDALYNHFAAVDARTIDNSVFAGLMKGKGVVETDAKAYVLTRLRQSLEKLRLVHFTNGQIGLFLSPKQGPVAMFGEGH